MDEYAAELSAEGCEVFARAADVSDTESLTKFFDDVQKNFGAGVVLIMGVVDNNEHFAPENIAEA